MIARFLKAGIVMGVAIFMLQGWDEFIITLAFLGMGAAMLVYNNKLEA